MKILIIIALLTLMLVPAAYSKPSDMFIDHLSDIVYNDCQNKDLYIKDGFIINTVTNKTVTLINWPYPYSYIRRIIELFGNYEPFDLQNGGITISGNGDGIGILKCGDHSLDINQFTYFWDGVRVDVPKEEIMQTYGNYSPIIKNNGDNNKIAIGQNNQVSETHVNNSPVTNTSGSLSVTIFNIPIDILSFSFGGITIFGGLTLYRFLKKKK
jgi:hypothetical protein